MVYVVVLIAALLHASWNGLLKHSRNRLRSLFINRLVAVPIGAALILYLPSIDERAWPYLIAATAIHLVYFWSLLRAYKHGDFSQVYPISRGIAPLIVLIIGFTFLSEPVSIATSCGIVLISIGIMLLARTDHNKSLKPLVFALITGCCIASYTLGRVDLCCTNFGLNGSVLIANQLCRPSGLSQRAVTKSKMLP